MNWEDKEISVLKEIYPKGNMKDICSVLNRSWDAIQAKALRLGIFREARMNIGEKNGQWRGGVNYDYYRRVAFEHYPNMCSVCGTKKKLEVHHKDKNRKNNVVENLMIVCLKCHKSIHKEMNGWALNHDECIICQTTKTRHNAHGMCISCYSKIRNSKSIKTRNKRHQKGSSGKYAKGTLRSKRK